MSRRPFAALLAALALVAGALVPNGDAAAQTFSYLFPNPDWGAAGTSGTWSVSASGSGWYPNCPGQILFGPDRAVVGTFRADGNGVVPATPVSIPRRPAAVYTFEAVQPDCRNVRAPGAPRSYATEFYAIGATALDSATGRDCAPAGADFVLEVRGEGYAYDSSENDVTVDVQRNGTTVAGDSNLPVSRSGTWATKFPVSAQPAGSTYRVRVTDFHQTELFVPFAIPCPVAPTTTSTTASTTTTTRPGSTTVPTTTSTTLPPPTPGATLVADPPIGGPGFVTQIRGTGFPPGPVQLRWEPGLGTATATVAADGTFTVPLLVLPNDRTGPRLAVATAGAVTAVAGFLAVPGTVRPSGHGVGHPAFWRK